MIGDSLVVLRDFAGLRRWFWTTGVLRRRLRDCCASAGSANVEAKVHATAARTRVRNVGTTNDWERERKKDEATEWMPSAAWRPCRPAESPGDEAAWSEQHEQDREE